MTSGLTDLLGETMKLPILCRFFGCKPHYQTKPMTCAQWEAIERGDEKVSCTRCGLVDCDEVNPQYFSPWDSISGWFVYWFYRRWWPHVCSQCGKRYGDHSDCIPF